MAYQRLYGVSVIVTILLAVGVGVGTRSVLDRQGGVEIVLQVVPSPGQSPTGAQIEAIRRIVADRVAARYGILDPLTALTRHSGAPAIRVQAPGVDLANRQEAETLLQTTGALTVLALPAPLPKDAPTGRYRVLASNADIDAHGVSVGVDNVGAPMVDAVLHDPGAKRVVAYTAAHVGGYLGIAIDGKSYHTPVIAQGVTGDEFQIGDTRRYEKTDTLAVILQHGPLPVPMNVVSVKALAATPRPSNATLGVLAGGAVGLIGLFIIVVSAALSPRRPRRRLLSPRVDTM